jgi:trk system potassium uptake protein TrkA
VVGIGLDEDTLRGAGLEGADAFLAVTNGDNSNIMTSQIAKFLFSVPRVLARVYDPLRAEVCRELGVETLCVTTLASGILLDRLFERPSQHIYWGLTEEMRRAYAPDLPTPQELSKRRASADSKRSYTIIAGGGKVGYQLARTLVWRGDEVLVIDKRPQRYQMLHDELGGVAYFGDACEIRTMVSVGMERADLVVAVTGDDEDNFVIGQVAKRWFGVPRAIARVNNPRNEEIFHRLGVTETISATRLLFQLIEQEVVTSDLVPLSLLQRGNLELVTVDVPQKSPAAGTPIKRLNLPKGCLLAAVIRGDECNVVTGDTILQPKDTVVALTDPAKIPALRQTLLGRS